MTIRRSLGRPGARAVLSLALLGGLFGGGSATTTTNSSSNPVVVAQDPYTAAPRRGLRGFFYQAARPAFDPQRRAPLLISSYAGRRRTDEAGSLASGGRRATRPAQYCAPAPGSAGAVSAPGFP
jgi:hypothetical protein